MSALKITHSCQIISTAEKMIILHALGRQDLVLAMKRTNKKQLH